MTRQVPPPESTDVQGWRPLQGDMEEPTGLRSGAAYLPPRTCSACCSHEAKILESGDVPSIVTTLRGMRVAWILKDENAVLEKLGYQSQRQDPDVAYQHAGIELRICHAS